MIKDQVKEIVNKVTDLGSEIPEVSLVFFANNIVIEDINIDATDSPLFSNFVKRYKRLGIESITIDTDCTRADIKGLIDVAAHPPRDVSVYDDINTLLIEKKVDKVYFNTVEFRIKSKGAEEGEGEGGGLYGEGFGIGGLGFGGFGEGAGEGEGGEGGQGEFNVNDFLSKGCGVGEGDAPEEEANKVTKGLIRLYDQIVRSSGDDAVNDYVPVFNEIINSMSPSARKEILTNKIKLSKISSIIKSIIMTFSDEEIVEIFLSKTRLLGVMDSKDILDELTPERLDSVLPDIRKGLQTMDIQEKYIKELEEALWKRGGGDVPGYGLGSKGGEGKGEGEGEGEGAGGSGEGGGGSGTGTGTKGVISDYVREFSESSDEAFGRQEISKFFKLICGLSKGEGQQVSKIIDGFETFANEFTKQFGEDEFLRQAGKIRKTFETAPDRIRERVFIQIIRKGGHLQMTMAKIVLPALSNDLIIKSILKMLKDHRKSQLTGFLSSIDKRRQTAIKTLLEKKLKSMNWDEKDINDLWEDLISSPRVAAYGVGGEGSTGDTSGGVSRRAYQRLQQRLRTGMDISEVTLLIKTLYDGLESPSPDVRINAIKNLKSVMDELIEGEKITIVRRIIDEILEYARKEENMNVFAVIVATVADIGIKAEEMEFEFILKDIVSFLAEEVDSVDKAEVIIPHLPRFKTQETRNVLLSLLWIDELRDMVIQRVADLGEESIPYLMELLKDTEDKEVRLALLNVIQSLGKEAVGVIKEYLEDERWYVRRNAVRILGVIGDEEIVDDIYKLRNDDKRIQIEIIRSIKRILKSNAESYILNFFSSDSPEVEDYAVAALKNIVTGKSLHVLSERLVEDKFSTSEEMEIKKTICDILGEEGSENSIDYLAEIINASKVFGIPQYPEDLRFQALRAALSIGGEKAVELAESLTRDRSKKIREYADNFLS